MENVGSDLKPNKCNIIFDRIADDVICARLEKGHVIGDLIYNQILTFIDDGFSVLVFRDKSSKYFLSKSHTKNYVLEKVNDSSQLH